MSAITSKSSATDQSFTWEASSLVFELGYLIALPAALFGFGGAYLDKHLNMSPLFVIAGLLLAFAVSAFAVIGKVRSITQKHS